MVFVRGKGCVSNLEDDTPSFREDRADPASLRYAVAR